MTNEVNLKQSDFDDISAFPLIWRWTSPHNPSFPAALLQQIRPLKRETVINLHLFAIDETEFNNITQFPAVDRRQAQRQFLLRVPDYTGTVIVSWGQLAVLLPWQVFCDFWDDFCYPSSDDTVIVPLDRKWVLQYSHGELFEFRCRRGA